VIATRTVERVPVPDLCALWGDPERSDEHHAHRGPRSGTADRSRERRRAGGAGALYLAGARLLDAVPLAPLVAGVRLSVTALSYDGRFVVSLLADEALNGLPLLAEGVRVTLCGIPSLPAM
jgi:WS/DGAT C-terminal domain